MENRCDCECLHSEELEKAQKILRKLDKYNCSMSEFFKTFADETRLKIISILDGLGRMCVCDIAVALSVTKSAISHQLSTLKKLNLVASQKVGKEVYYSLADEHIRVIYELGVEHIKEAIK